MSTVIFDVVRASTKYVVDENGDLSQVAANTPAFEYNADGTYKGMLVEDQRENICLQSEDFGTTWDAFSNASITTNQGAAPDGNTTADELTRTAVSSPNTRVRQQTITVSNSTVYTASVFVKNVDCNGGTAIGFRVTSGTLFRAIIDWSTNTIANDAGTTTQKLIAYPNNWYRASVTFTTDGTDGNFEIDLDRNNDSELTSILLWGAQLEVGENASSYIPTTTTSVTRNADDISNISASTYVGQTAGTVYVEATIDNIITNASIISVSDGTNDNIVRIRFNANADMRMYVDAGTTSIISDVETIVAGTYKFAVVYSASDTRVYRNGVQLSSSTTSLSFTSSVDEIDIGQSFAATGQSNNWIRAFAFYKRALTDTEAIALTS